MSDSTRLGISITAQDTNATASIKQLQATVKGLQETLASVGGSAADAAGKISAALNAEISSINREISARAGQAAAIKTVTAALKEQGDAAAVVHRTLLQGIYAATGASPDRGINSAAEAARVLATALSAAAEADDRLRVGVAATLTAMREMGVEAAYINREFNMASAAMRAEAIYINRDKDMASRATRSEASYINRDKDLAFGQSRAEATYENRDRDLVANKAAAEADYINRNIDLQAQKARAEAEYSNRQIELIKAKEQAEASYINSGMNAEAARARAEAEYTNRNAELIAGYQRAEAEYINRNADLIYTRMRREADLENTNFDLKKKAETRGTATGASSQRSEAEYINRDMDLAAAAARAEANYINNNGNLSAAKASAEARYINQDIDLIGMKQRAEAEYINQGMTAEAAKGRAEAEYENQTIELIRAKQRAEADYINQSMSLASLRARQEAEYMNRDFDLRNKSASSSASSSGTNSMLRHGVALFDEAARGQRGAMFSTIGAAARDAGLSVGALTTSVTGLMAIMAGAAVLRGAENMGEWATKTRAAASAAGMGIEQYSALQGALALVGVKADSADATLRRIAVNLSTALSDPASKAAEAFHNLGISQSDLVKNGSDTAGVLHLLADAFVKTNDSENKSAALSAIAGRGFESIIPALQDGSEALGALEAKAKELGLTLTEDTAVSLEKTGEKVKTVSETIRGDAIKAFEAWAPAIEVIIKVLGTLGSVITETIGLTGQLVSAIGNMLTISQQAQSESNATALAMQTEAMRRYQALNPTGSVEALGPPISGTNVLPASGMGTGLAKTDVGPMTTPVSVKEALNLKMAQDSLNAAQGTGTSRQATEAATKAQIADIQQVLAADKAASAGGNAEAKLTNVERTELMTELANKELSLKKQELTAGAAAAKQSYQDFAAGERLKVSEAQGNTSAIIAIYKDWATQAAGIYKQTASTILAIQKEEVQAEMAAKLQMIKETTKQDEDKAKLSSLNEKLSAIHGGTMVYPGQNQTPGTEAKAAQRNIADAQQIESSTQVTIATLTELANTAAKGSTVQKQAQDFITQLLIQSKSQEIELYMKAGEAAVAAAKKLAAPFTQFFDSIGSQFETFTSGLLKALIAPQQDLIKQGLTTIKRSEGANEVRQAISSLLMSGIQDATKTVETALGHMLANALSGGASNSIGELLGNWLSKGFTSLTGIGGNAASSATLSLAGTTLNTAGVTLSAAATELTAAATSLTAAASTSVGSSATGLLGDAGTASLMFFARGGIVPSAAGGMISSGGLSLLHPKEMVLPEHISTGLQQMIRGGNSQSNANLNYSPTINTGARGRGGNGMTRAEFGQATAMHSGAMLGMARSMMGRGWRPA